jgi:hypothetical protein
MIRIGANGNKITYGIKHYILDTEEDFNLLPSNRESMGTTCFVIKSSKYYIVNGALEWIEITPYNGGTGSGGEEDKDIIYDGGQI